MKSLLAKLGKLGKGLATPIGAIATALGVTLGGDELGRCAAELSKHPDAAVGAVGILLTVFGVARKAGWLGRASSASGA